jgi:riboflavin kinase/FMN adenylyltransferase
VLVRSLDARLVVVGEGNPLDVEAGHRSQLGQQRDVALSAVAEVEVLAEAGGDAVSSTRIRQLVADGDVGGAAVLLGRDHQVRGEVVHGDGRGGPELGFPTANVDVPAGIALPGLGIYAGRYRRPDGSRHPAAISVGNRPTFYERAPGPLVEAYLLDFDGDLYGEEGQVSFARRLREERRFDRVEDLVAQMQVDVEEARRVLAC